MKKLIIGLALFAYGAAALALNTIIVNKTPYVAELTAYTSQEQISFCQMHGLNTVECHQGKIRLQPTAGFIISNDIYLETVALKTNNYNYHIQKHDEFIFKINKWLFPHRQLKQDLNDSQHNDLVVSDEENKNNVIINLQLLTSAQFGFQVLYLEEPRLFPDKSNKDDPTAPMIFSYQPNNYGNNYGNAYGNCYGNECGNRVGNI